MTLTDHDSERFWANVHKGGPDECWIWTASRNQRGAGHLWVGPLLRQAHRISYGLHNGPIPGWANVLHKCDNPPCVNPRHLFLGTQRDNMEDMFAKGRSGILGKPGQAGTKNGLSKLDDDAVRHIRSLGLKVTIKGQHNPDGPKVTELATVYKVSTSAVRLVIAGKTWKHVL